MVNVEAVKLAAPSLLASGKQWILDSIRRTASDRRTHPVLSESGNAAQEPRQQETSTEYLVINWLESLFTWFQVIILWHEPFMSLCAISGLLSSFLLLTFFAPRFYASIAIVIFIYNLNKFWFRYVWPDIRLPPNAERETEMRLDVDRFTYLHPQLMTLAELGQHLGNLIELSEGYLIRMLQMRQDRPIAFCSVVCSVLSVTAYIGHKVSGASLVFWTLLLTMIAPGIYQHTLPQESKAWLKKNLTSIMRKASSHSHCKLGTESDSPRSIGKERSNPENDQERAAPSDDDEPLTSNIISATRTQALSLYESLKRRSFAFASVCNEQQQSVDSAMASHGDSDAHQRQSGITAVVPSPTIDVPRSHDLDDQSKSGEANLNVLRRRRDNQCDEDERPSRTSSGKENYSSNSSVSLIDSDDEQQDGFVLL